MSVRSAEIRWGIDALKVAQAVRAQNPSATRAEVSDAIRAQVPAAPNSERSLRTATIGWEVAGELNLNTPV